MASSAATTVQEYLASLPADRREALESVRRVIRKNLPKGFEEGMQYGMIGYYVPLSRYPQTYNGQPLGIAALASQKGYMSLYLMGVYGDPATQKWFEAAYRKSGKQLDMGKSCVRFKRVEDLALDVVGQVISRVGVDDFIARYEAVKGSPRAKGTAKKTPAKRAAAKPATKKKTATRRTRARARV
ncbi:MAG: DUF1801 domain-containing protein [Myxococcota bacterium]